MLATASQAPKTAMFLEAGPQANKKLVLVPPRRIPNKELRAREYLTTHEIEALKKSARGIGRQGSRDDALVLLMFRHGLRVSEIINLRWEQIDLKLGLLHVKRIKKGIPSTHPLRAVELRALRQLRRAHPHSAYVFLSERQAPLAARTVRHIVARAGELADLGFTIHPHMLRHSTGFYLANEGQDTRAIQSYMGHSNIKNTTIYTELSPKRFNKFWND